MSPFNKKKVTYTLIPITITLGVILGFTPIYKNVYYKFGDRLYRGKINLSICDLEQYNFNGQMIFANDYSGHESEKFLYAKIQNFPSYKYHSQKYPAHEQAISFQRIATEYLKTNSKHYAFSKDLQPNSIIIRILSVPAGRITIPEDSTGHYELYMDICNNKVLRVIY